VRDGSGTLLPPPDDALAAELAAGELGSLAALFVAAGSRPPTVIWTPAAEQLQSAVLRDLQRLWRETLGCGRRWSPPLLPELGALQDDVMLVAVEEAGADFHYVHYGRNVARAYGRDMVGRRTSEFPGHISRFFAAVYRATLLRRVPVYTDHEPPLGLLVTGWHRLILPLFGRDDGITMFMVGNIADSPLRHVVDMVADPVVVFEPTGRVRLINRPAEQLLAMSEAEATARQVAELLQHPLVADLASGRRPARLRDAGAATRR
jgi:PAS domain-containing protein